jgi:hypothetical protein
MRYMVMLLRVKQGQSVKRVKAVREDQSLDEGDASTGQVPTSPIPKSAKAA